MKLFLALTGLLALVLSVQAGSECQWGASYWCQSMATAQQCQQVQYCQEQVWKSTHKEEKALRAPHDGITCEVCKLVAGYIDKLLDANSTEGEAEKLTEELCNYLGAFASECKDLIGKYFDDIWKLLEEELQPDTVCSQLGLCSSTEPAIKAPQAPQAFECKICKFIVGEVDKLLAANATEAEAKRLILDVCSKLGPLSSECTDLMNEYFDAIWNLVIQELSADVICTRLGLCSSTKLAKQAPSAPQGLECTLCTLVVGYLEKQFLNNQTEQRAEAAILDVCSVLGPLKTECEDLVKQYFGEIWNYLKNEVSPDEICSLLKLCSSTKLSKPALSAPKLDLKCAACDAVMWLVNKLVASNSTKVEAETIVQKVCGLLGDLKSECDDLIDYYWDDVWEMVVKEVSPGVICPLIFKECTSTKQVQSSQKSPKAPRADLCDMCKLVVNFLKPYVDSNATENEVKTALEGLCNILPSSLSSECKTLVEGYFGIVWNLVKSEFDNDEICKQLGFCSSTKTVPKVQSSPKPPKAPRADLCDICKLLVSFIKPFVDSNSTEEEVEDALENLCGVLPSSISSELLRAGVEWKADQRNVYAFTKTQGLGLEWKTNCLGLVKEFFPIVWSLVKSEFDNGQICKVLGLCNSTKTVLKVQSSQKPLKAPRQSLCDICKLLVSFIKPFVDSNSTQEEVEDALEKLCGLLPSSISKECNSTVKEYFPAIWLLLKAYVDDGQICQLIRVCNSTTVTKPALRHPKAPREDLCQICEMIIDFIKPFLDNNSTETEVENALEAYCKLLPSSFQQECNMLVTQYFPMIWKLLQSYVVNPNETCKLLGLCTKQTFLRLTKAPPHPKASEDELCALCKDLNSLIKPFVDNNATEEEVKNLLTEVCDILPSEIKDECNSVVSMYFDMGWQVFKALVDSGMLCQEIGVCNSTKARMGMAATPPAAKAAPKAGILCTICEYIMEKVESLLVNNATEAEIVAALDKVCGLLPSTIRTECDDFVKEYGPAIINLLLKAVGPKVICTTLGLCSLSAVDMVQSDSGCTMCKLALSFIKDFIASNSTAAEITKVLEYVCNFMPTTFRNECKTFVEDYAKQIIQLIDDEISPGAICQKLGLCSSSKKMSPLMQPWLKLVRPNN